MAIQSVSSNNLTVSDIYADYAKKDKNTKADSELKAFADSNNSNKSNSTSLQFAASYFSSNTTTVEYQSNDGDSVSISSKSMEIQQALLTGKGSNDPAEWKKVIDYLKNQYESFKEDMIASLTKSNEDKKTTSGTTQPVQPAKTSTSSDIQGLPEYWNAENTSQRIVDFATSFSGLFKGSKDEFISMIKDAVEQGFKQAKDILGNVNDQVSALVNNTHDLTMKKLDEWANKQENADGKVTVA